MNSVKNGALSVWLRRAGLCVLSAACGAIVLQQAACPIVAVLAKVAPSRHMIEVAQLNGDDECAPCKAGADDCLQQLINWMEAQVNGDPSVPFPDGDCLEQGGGA